MNRIVVYPLVAVALIASGDIAWTVSDYMRAAAVPGSVVRRSDVPQGSVAAVPAGQSGRDVATILARPLFNPDRRQPASSTSVLSGLPRLSGIVISDTDKVAIFSAPGGGKAVLVSEGARIGAYNIQSIDATGVTVAGPEGVRTVRPLFDPNAPSATKAAPPRPIVAGPRKQ